MLSILILSVLAAGGWRAGRAAREALRHLPRSNDDMVFF